MSIDMYLDSPGFRIFRDEALRSHAVRTAEKIFAGGHIVKRHQIQALPGVIQGAGLEGLREFTHNQKNKNTRNKEFWAQLDLIISKTSPSDHSLFRFMKDRLLEQGLIEDEEAPGEKTEKKRIRKRNHQLVDMAMEHVLDVYFEHFNCHYFYKKQQGDQ